MRRLEQWAVREFSLPLMVMMEHVGRLLADLVLRRFAPAPSEAIVVLAGKGGNGGGALAAGRHLLHRGYTVTALLVEQASKYKDEPLRQVDMFRKEGGTAPPFFADKRLPPAALLLDGLLGYGLLDAAKGTAAEMIEAANAHEAPVVSLDTPSGLDPDTGTAKGPVIEAAATLAVALPKHGVLEAAARRWVGELYLADIALPRRLYSELDVKPEQIFGGHDLVRL
jgi:NAD(P)H-hydrate epimerase